MAKARLMLGAICALAIGLAACGGEQSDWEKARASNNAETYEAFVHKYPNGSFAAQAQARLKELYEERDWQKARDILDPKVFGRRGTPDDVRKLKSLCKQQADKQCLKALQEL